MASIFIFISALLIIFLIIKISLIYLKKSSKKISSIKKLTISVIIVLFISITLIILVISTASLKVESDTELNKLKREVNKLLKEENYIGAIAKIKSTDQSAEKNDDNSYSAIKSDVKLLSPTVEIPIKTTDEITDYDRMMEYDKVFKFMTNKINLMILDNISHSNFNYIKIKMKHAYSNIIELSTDYKKEYSNTIYNLSMNIFSNHIETLILNNEYSNAYNTIINIKDNDLWISKINNNILNKIKENKIKTLASSLNLDFDKRINIDDEEMNKYNYDFIYDQILYTYNQLPKNAKSEYEKNFESNKYNMDIKRDEYLQNLIEKISKITNTNEVVEKLKNEIYHYSDRKKEKKSGMLSAISAFAAKSINTITMGYTDLEWGNISYKDYWKKIKTEYLKEFDKK